MLKILVTHVGVRTFQIVLFTVCFCTLLSDPCDTLCVCACVCIGCFQEVHAAAIRSLAELTARSIELFHKLAEMIVFSGGSAEAAILSQ